MRKGRRESHLPRNAVVAHCVTPAPRACFDECCQLLQRPVLRNPYGAGGLAHDLRDRLHIEVGQDTQGHDLGLVAGQCAKQREDVGGLHGLDRQAGHVGGIDRLDPRPVLDQIDGAPDAPAGVVDDLAPRDREQPRPKRALVAFEPVDPTNDCEPRLRCGVLGELGVANLEIPKEWRVQCVPERRECRLVALRGCENLRVQASGHIAAVGSHSTSSGEYA